MGTFSSYVGLGLGIGLSWLVSGVLAWYLLIRLHKQPGSAIGGRSPVKNPLPEDFQRELNAHGICPWTVHQVQRLDGVTPSQIEMLRAMAKEGQTRGVGILEVACHGKPLAGKVVYIVSAMESGKMEDTIIAFLGHPANFSGCLD